MAKMTPSESKKPKAAAKNHAAPLSRQDVEEPARASAEKQSRLTEQVGLGP